MLKVKRTNNLRRNHLGSLWPYNLAGHTTTPIASVCTGWFTEDLE